MKGLIAKYALIIFCLFFSLAMGQRLLSSSEEILEAIEIGGTYRLAEGRYEFDHSLEIDRGLTLIGENATTTVIAVATEPGGLAVSVDSRARVSFQHLGIERLGEEAGDVLGIVDTPFMISHCIILGGVYNEPLDGISYGDGLYVQGSSVGTVLSTVIIDNDLVGLRLVDNSSLRLIDSLIANSSDIGISIGGESSIYIYQSDVTKNIEGIHIEGQAVIRESTVFDNLEYAGIGLYDSGQLILQDSEVYGNADGALNFFDQSVGLVLDSNLSSNENTGVYVGDSASAWVYGTTITDNPSEGFYLDGEAFVFVAESEVASNSESGFFLQEQARAVIRDTDVSDNQEFRGVDADGQSQVVVIDSYFSQNGTGAMSIVEEATAIVQATTMVGPGEDDSEVYIGGSAFAIFKDAVFDISDGVAILVGDTALAQAINSDFSGHSFRAIEANGEGRLRLSGSRLQDNLGQGVGLYDQASAIIIGNTIVNNDGSGIYLEDDSFAYIAANHLANNNGSGIFFVGGNGIVSDNEIIENEYNGVEAKGFSRPLIVANRIKGHASENGNAAVFIHEEARAHVIDNAVTANNYGVFMRDESMLREHDNRFSGNDTDIEDRR